MVLVKNVNFSVGFGVTALQIFGFWRPEGCRGYERWLYNVYGFAFFMFILGSYILAQLVDMVLIWGNLQLMTGIAFLLFTNLAQSVKIVNIVSRRSRIGSIISENQEMMAQVQGEGRRIVESCNRETKNMLLFYIFLTGVTLAGWASSAEKNQLPMAAWYPYDTSKSPAYELTYAHQIGSIILAAALNVAKDSLTTSLIAQVRCRLELINLALRSVHEDLDVGDKSHSLLSEDQDKLAARRLRECIISHQKTLAAAVEIQECFSEATFGQFSVSMVIICVTAFQLASLTRNPVRLASMGTYLMNMIYQVFLHCYQGNQLREESISIAEGAYETNWPISSTRFRRSLLVLMMRTRRPVQLYAGKFTSLSLQSFMAIVKTSYSFFTVLQQVVDSE